MFIQNNTDKKSGFNKPAINTVIYLYFVAILIFLLYLIKISPDKFISDERDFVPNIKVLAHYGFSFAFLRNIVGQSPGPLYQFIYYPIGKLVNLTPKGMRVINYLFLLGDICLLGLLVRTDLKKHRALIPLLIMAIPMTWNISGMAFTELPSLFFCLLSLLLLRKALDSANGFSVILSLLAGLSAGTGIIGRSPFLMLIPAAFLLFLIPGKKSEITIFLLASLIFPSIVFSVWHGLVPPDVQNIQSGYNIWYLLLCITYFAITTLIIYPQFFVVKKIHYYIAVGLVILFVLLNALVFKIKYMPMNGVFTSKRIPSFISAVYPYLFQALTVGCSYVFIVALYFYNKVNKSTVWDFFLLAISGLIVFTTIKSAAHFTSKYVMQAYPFFLLYIAGNIKVNKYLLIRIVIGSLIGITTLYTYYSIHSALNY